MIELKIGENKHNISEKHLKELFLELSTARMKVSKKLEDISDEIALLDNISFLSLRRHISLKLLDFNLSISELFNVIFDLVITNDEIKKLDIDAIEDHNLVVKLSDHFAKIKEHKSYDKLIKFIITKAKKYHYDPLFIIILYYFRNDIRAKLDSQKSIFSFSKKSNIDSQSDDMVYILLKLGYGLDEALTLAVMEAGNYFYLISKKLLEAGANPTLAARNVVIRGDIQFLKLLTNYNIDLNQQDNHGDTLLMLAVERGDAIAVCLLLDKDATKINLVNHDNETALIKACKRGDLIISSLLIHKGADINLCDSQGLNALFYAIEKSEKILIKILLEHKADYKAMKSVYNRGMKEKRIHFIELLIELQNLSQSEYAEIIKSNTSEDNDENKYISEYEIALLNLKQKANYSNIVTPDTEIEETAKIDFIKQAALVNAIIKNDIKIVEELINNKQISLSIINVCDLQHSDFIHLIAYYNQIEILSLFLTQNIDINIADAEGNNAIFIALLNNHLEMFKILYAKKANIYHTNNHGFSAYDLLNSDNFTEFKKIIALKNE